MWLAIAVLATWQAVEIWRHSSLFAGLRARLETGDGWFSRLLLCPFCLSVWIGLLFAAWTTVVPAAVSPRWLEVLLQLPVLGLAVSRGANLCNDLFYTYCRTPRIDRVTEDQS